MTSKERKRIRNLNESMLRTSSICLSSKSNPFARLRTDDRYQIIAAFVAASSFTYEFDLIGMPELERVIELYEEYTDSLPEVLHLEGHAYKEDFYGTQYADFNVRTLELVFTHYTIHPCCTFNQCKGKGKIPLDDDGYFSIEKYIPME